MTILILSVYTSGVGGGSSDYGEVLGTCWLLTAHVPEWQGEQRKQA